VGVLLKKLLFALSFVREEFVLRPSVIKTISRPFFSFSEDLSLEGARMRTLFSLRLLLGLSRLLGCFPYAVKLNPPKITFKKHLFAYSVVFIAFAIT